MTVQFAGSRSTGERRRRRLAVNGDGSGADAANSGEEKSLPDCVPAEFCAASPWIPRSPWKLWSLTAFIMTALVSLQYMVFYTPTFRPELSDALTPLIAGENPRLVSYLKIVFWTLSGQLAMLIGWHRAQSRLDFRGRYRIWPWAAALLFLSGFCVATQLHVGLGAVLQNANLIELNWRDWGWLLPLSTVACPMAWLIDRDLRRSRSSLILYRISLMCLLTGIIVRQYSPTWIPEQLALRVTTVCGLFGPALLMLSLWVHGWYVAYVTPDPPTTRSWQLPQISLRTLNPFRWLFQLVMGLFRRQPKEEPATPRRRKKAEESGTVKRKRKTKRATKPRTKKVVEEEEAEDDAEADEVESESELEDESAESNEEAVEEEDVEEEDTSPARVSAAQSNKASSSRSEAASSASRYQQDDDEYESDESYESEDNGKQYRIDGPPADMMKGLSKRQKRALQKQWRDQQRGQ